jgi:uncharacterized alpha-E superfamily protein
VLSRVAESLYWMARYVERAEDLTRVLSVTFDGLLEASTHSGVRGWQPVLRMSGEDAAFAQLHSRTTTAAVIEFMVWHPDNPSSVIASITRARENARSVRDQISSEMWESLNRLYFLVHDTDRRAVVRNPRDLFMGIRDGSQAFQGTTATTMAHGEGFEFIALGHHLERADKTARMVAIGYPDLARLAPGSPEASLQMIALLRACSAFEPFRRVHSGTVELRPVTEYLLLDRQFPRSVAFCVDAALSSVGRIVQGPAERPEGASRTLGRMRAELEYLDLDAVLGSSVAGYLEGVLARLYTAADEIAKAYFDTRVIVAEARPQQQQQQQQQRLRRRPPGIS